MHILSSAALGDMARSSGFELVGFARAEPIPPRVLTDWLEAGHHADLDWFAQQLETRLDVSKVLPNAKTVIALACNYWHTDEESQVARYARGRDYHLTLRDRLRTFRSSLRQVYRGVADYGSVDANPVMEKVWATRAGLGYVGKNGCLITPQFGSWVLLAAVVLDAPVDHYASQLQPDICGKCTICITSCPTGAIVAERTVDARACLSFQTIENEGSIPPQLAQEMTNLTFGCDICQTVCPLNSTPVLAHERFAPRAVAALTVEAMAQLTREQYQQLIPGTPLARAGFDGLRRNAAYALGAARDRHARPILEALTRDEAPQVREAAMWALGRLDA